MCQSLEETRAGIAFKQPKTNRSRRSIHLPTLVSEALALHRGEQAQHRLNVGPASQDHGVVIAQDDGRPRTPDNLAHAFAKFVRSLGISLRFHDLRHSHATQLLKQGTNPKIVSERLGHATIALTMDTYSHVIPGMGEEAARKVDAALRQGFG